MKDLLFRNYEAVVARGKITEDTTDIDMRCKLNEEVSEVHKAFHQSEERITEEIVDIMVVCSNWLIKRGVDLEEALIKNAIKNEKRAKNGE